MQLAQLLVAFGVDVSEVQQGLDEVSGRFRDVGRQMTQVGGILTAAVTAPLVGVGAASIKLAGDMEQAQIAFTTMLGSAERAGAFLEELQDFAAHTPFEFTGLQNASRQLLAFGFQAEEIIPMMTSIGDAVSGLGGGEFEIQRVVRALGQMQAKGKTSAQEMMQLAELGIPAWQYLADAIGTTVPEAMKRAEQGAIDSRTTIDAVLQGMNSNFGGMMEEQSQTLLGLWSTFKDEATLALTDLGMALLPAIKQLLQGLFPVIEAVGRLVEMFTSLPAPVQQVILVGLAVAAALGPFLVVAGSILSAVGTLLPVLGALVGAIGAIAAPVAIAVAAIAALVAGVVLLYQRNEEFRSFVLAAWEAIKNGVATAIDTIQQLWTEYGDEFLAAVRQTWDAIKAVYGTQLAAIRAAIEGFVAVVKELWDAFGREIFETVRAIWGEIFETILHYAGLIQELWDEHGAAVLEIIGGHLAALKELVDSLLEPIRQGWELWGDEILTIVGALWDQVKNIFATAMGIIREGVGLVLAAIRMDWGDFSDHLQGLARVLWDGIMATGKNFQTVFVALVQGIWDAVKAVFTKAMDEIKGKVEAFTDAVIAPFQRLRDVVVGHSIVPEMWDAIAAEFDRGTAETGAILEAGTEDMIGMWQEAFDGILGSARDWLNELGGIFGQGFGDWLGKAGDFLGKLDGAFGGGFGGLLDRAGDFVGNMGKSLIGGLGLEGVFGSVSKFISGPWGAAIMGALDLFGIDVNKAISAIADGAVKALGVIGEGVGAAAGAIGDAVGSLAGGVADVVGGIGSALGSLVGIGGKSEAEKIASAATYDAAMAAAVAAYQAQHGGETPTTFEQLGQTSYKLPEVVTVPVDQYAAFRVPVDADLAAAQLAYAMGTGPNPFAAPQKVVLEIDGREVGSAVMPYVVDDARLKAGLNET